MTHAQLAFLQLVSPTLPVGGFNYSEGIEWLVEANVISDRQQLQQWLTGQLEQGSIRVEAVVMARAFRLSQGGVPNSNALAEWNQWLTATRETAELRQQSQQMGSSLQRLLIEITPDIDPYFQFLRPDESCHWTIAFGIAAAYWQITIEEATQGFLYSWINNLVSAGVRLIPLGQTAGQQVLFTLHGGVLAQTPIILDLADEDLYSCSWGLGLASMNHETQYTRLFRS